MADLVVGRDDDTGSVPARDTGLGAPVRLVRLNGGHEDREEEEDRGCRSRHKYDTFGTK